MEVEDPERPGSRLYTWKEYESNDKTKLRSVLEDDTGAAGFHDNLDLDWGFARTDTARTASSSSQAPLQLTDGKVEVDDAAQLVGFTGAAPQPTTPKTPTSAGKVWAKVNDAIRVGNNIIFRAQLAVRSLGKGQLAQAAAGPLVKLVSEAESQCKRFMELAMQHSDGTLAAQVDAGAVMADVKKFHTLCQELQKGEKSALALRGC